MYGQLPFIVRDTHKIVTCVGCNVGVLTGMIQYAKNYKPIIPDTKNDKFNDIKGSSIEISNMMYYTTTNCIVGGVVWWTFPITIIPMIAHWLYNIDDLKELREKKE